MKLISISIGQKTQKVRICFIHFKSHVASLLKRNSSLSLKAFWKGPGPTPPTPSSPHWLLLYVEEIETSIKLGLLLGTKESDILQWRIPLWFKPLDLITPILHLYERNSISMTNYVRVGLAPFSKTYKNHLSHWLALLSSAVFTSPVFFCSFFISEFAFNVLLFYVPQKQYGFCRVQ